MARFASNFRIYGDLLVPNCECLMDFLFVGDCLCSGYISTGPHKHKQQNLNKNRINRTSTEFLQLQQHLLSILCVSKKIELNYNLSSDDIGIL